MKEEIKIVTDVVSINEITEIEKEIKREVKRICIKHEKSHLVSPLMFIEIKIRRLEK